MSREPTTEDRLAPLSAGVSYFAAIFALGFVLGAARTVTLEQIPGLSRMSAVLLELPIILGASWLACPFFVRRFRVSPTWRDRAIMGGVAFLILMLAEIGLDMALAGKTVTEHFAQYREPSHAAGLAAQIAFAVIPLLQLRRPAPVPQNR